MNSPENNSYQNNGFNSFNLSPLDAFNQQLIKATHPPDWVNPTPTEPYNLVVIGAGTAGLVVAAGSAMLGAKVALIEKHLMGGDCLNLGCVPSKAIISSARVLGSLQKAADLGIELSEAPQVNFAKVMEHLREKRAEISHHDSAQRFRDLGIDVYLGEGRFLDAQTVEVAGQKLTFKKAVIATGTQPQIPDIPGLTEAGFLTNETIFNLTEKPKRLAVIGGGYIGCELAQTFRRLGSEVTILQRSDRLLPREDKNAVELLQQVFQKEGIQIILNSQIKQIKKHSSGKIIYCQSQDKETAIVVDEILISTGRKPKLESLNLDAVGVKHDLKKGVLVNDFMQTSNPKIYAAGDICMDWKFTHTADAAARIVIQNALFLGRKKLSSLTMPWCIYTDPEIAHVGMYPEEAQAKGIEVDTYHIPFSKVDRAIVANEEMGFVKVYTQKGSDRILGATIVSPHAGDMISEVTLAMVGNLGLGTLAKVIHPYPTLAEGIRKAADAYNSKKLTPLVKRLFTTWLKWNR